MKRMLRTMFVVLPLLFVSQSAIAAAQTCCCADHSACADCCDCCDCCTH